MKRVLPVVLVGLVAVAIVFAVAIAFGQNQPRILLQQTGASSPEPSCTFVYEQFTQDEDGYMKPLPDACVRR